jgi:Arc/MetJ-type ribon-helix-helix transcriptional regulator
LLLCSYPSRIGAMKVSVSLPDEDVAFLDDYARSRGDSRSAALHRAVRLLRERGLGAEYAAAWEEWHEVGGSAWEQTIADGLERDAPR